MLPKLFANSRSLRRMFSASATVVVASFAASIAPSSAAAQLVDFESLGYGPGCQWNGGPAVTSLGGKQWSDVLALDLGNLYGAAPNGCGLAATSGYSLLQSANIGNVIGLGSGAAYLHSTTPFVLNSLVAGAGWQNNTKLTLTFFLGGVLKDTRVLTLSTYETGASTFDTFYTGATDWIGFTPDYSDGQDVFNSQALACIGKPQGCQDRYESWFVDNLDFTDAVISPVVTPEPGTFALLGVGLAVAAGAARRRRRTV